MNMEQLLLRTFINQSAKNYIEFMGVEKFPQFEIAVKSISLSDATQKGFGSLAAHHYDVPTGTHSLVVWSDIYIAQLRTEYLLFHEFTHILDTEIYVQQDRLKNVKYRGFFEYHAGQIDFLKALGAKRADENLRFSMKQTFEIVGSPNNAQDYVSIAHDTASSLINRSDFPADVETLSTMFGLIFNYWGRRSICKMYAIDYVEQIDNETIKAFIGEEQFKALDAFMDGWLNTEQVALISEFYFQMIGSKIQEYSL